MLVHVFFPSFGKWSSLSSPPFYRCVHPTYFFIIYSNKNIILIAGNLNWKQRKERVKEQSHEPCNCMVDGSLVLSSRGMIQWCDPQEKIEKSNLAIWSHKFSRQRGWLSSAGMILSASYSPSSSSVPILFRRPHPVEMGLGEDGQRRIFQRGVLSRVEEDTSLSLEEEWIEQLQLLKSVDFSRT